jgi:hypothetical protein
MLLLLPVAVIGADIVRRRASATRRARVAADRVGPVRAQIASHIAEGRSGSIAAPAAAGKALDAALSLAIGRPTAGLTRARLGAALADAGDGRTGSTSAPGTMGAGSAGAPSAGARSTTAATDLVARTLALYGDIDGFRFAGTPADQAAASTADDALLDRASALAEEWLRRVEALDRAAAHAAQGDAADDRAVDRPGTTPTTGRDRGGEA